MGNLLPRPTRPCTIGNGDDVMDENEKVLHAAEELLQDRNDVRAGQALAEAHAADIAHVFQQLPLADRATIFRSLRPDQAGDVLSELDDATLLELVRSLDDVEVSMILDRMPAEHAADVVDELSSEHAERSWISWRRRSRKRSRR